MTDTILLIPHFNNPTGLIKSLKSIGKDENIDVLIVDDGSIDSFNEADVMSSFKAVGKVFFIYLSKNMGITIALNTGLEYVKKINYKYISRLDCGDTCHPNRFETQKQYLENNPEIGIVGSHVDYIDMEGKFLYTLKFPLKDREIRSKLFINSMISHPTFFMRKELVDRIGFYPDDYPAAEDLAFLFKVKASKYKFANVDEVLVNVEYNENSISGKSRDKQVKSRIKLIKDNFDFSRSSFFGLIRSYLLFFIPRDLLLITKNIF